MARSAPTLASPDVLKPRISARSTWHDEIWYFDLTRPGTTDSSRSIMWAFELPDGSRFTDSVWADMRETVKRFLWSLRIDPPAGKRRLSVGTLISVFSQTRVLVKWMVGQGYTKFAQIDVHAATDFLDSLETRPGHRQQKLAIGTRAGYLVTIGRLYAQRAKLPDSVPEDLTFFLDEYRPRNRRLDRAGRGFPHTPDAVATALISGALRLIGTPAEDVLALRDLAVEAYGHRDKRRPSEALELEARSRLHAFAFAILTGETDPWQKPVNNLNEVNTLIGRIYDACYVVIAWLVGARVSEILGLEAGCIKRHQGPGGEEITYLHGRIYKTATGDGSKPHRWIAPAPVVHAIGVLERLSAPAREQTGRPSLWLLTRDCGATIRVRGWRQSG